MRLDGTGALSTCGADDRSSSTVEHFDFPDLRACHDRFELFGEIGLALGQNLNGHVADRLAIDRRLILDPEVLDRPS